MVRHACSIVSLAVAYVFTSFVGYRGIAPIGSSEEVAEAALANPVGGISGRVVFEGEILDRRLVVQAGNPRVDGLCCSEDIFSNEIVINPDDRGVMHAFVYLRSTVSPEQIPALLNKRPESPVNVEIEGCQFWPHASIVRTGQPIEVTSLDPTPHTVRTLPALNRACIATIPYDFNSTEPMPVGSLMIEGYSKRERVPFEVQCNDHKWMAAYWLVVDHPYAAVTDFHGRFTISGLPAGEHEFIVWHELTGFIHRKLRVKISPGETTDVKEISVAADRFR